MHVDEAIIRCPRLESGTAKKVTLGTAYRDHTRTLRSEPFASDFKEIRRNIESGQPLDERFYRSKIDENVDELLELRGINHLHLGGQNSNVLLYLAELPSIVILLEVNDHKHLDIRPVGAMLQFELNRSLQKALKYAREEAAAQAIVTAARREAFRSRIREGFGPAVPRQDR